MLSGVTFVTHGFNSSADTWIDAMADSIADRIGSDDQVAEYRLEVWNGVGGGDDYSIRSFTQESANAWNEVSTGEAVVRLDWSDIDGYPPSHSTADIGAVVVDWLIENSEWLQAPLHFIAHSRGASLFTEVAERLGKIGVWVDQVTSLDPHPVDGIRDPFGFDFGDAPMNAWENTAFWDNYWRTEGDTSFLDFTGEPVTGALNRNLGEDVLGEQPNGIDPGYSSEHSDTHLWYHGTINVQGPISDGSINNFDPDAFGWYNGTNGPRAEIGYYYSRVVGGARPTAGVHDKLGGTGARQPIDWTNANWPNLLNFDFSTGQRTFKTGEPVPVSYYYHDADSNATTAFYFDSDRNPHNDNAIEAGPSYVQVQTPDDPSSDSKEVPTDGVPPGSYYLSGRISDSSGNTRWVYATDQITLQSDSTVDFLGMYSQEFFYLDTTQNGVWDKVSGGDTFRDFGINSIRATAQAVIGDWDGDGDDDLGVYNEGFFHLDTTQNGVWDKVSGGDTFRDFGINPIRATATPVIGDWDGDGDDDLGLYNDGFFYLDTTQNGAWDKVSGGDAFRDFGINSIRATAVPVIGDWDGDGDDDLGLYDEELFYLDTTQNGVWDKVSGGDTFRDFGINPIRATAQPLIGDWDGDGDDDLGVHQAGLFYLDMTQNGIWDKVSGGDTFRDFGINAIRSTGLPLAGRWPAPVPLMAAGGPEVLDAAGHGWFIDATPEASEEFSDAASQSLVAGSSGTAADRMDLLTVVLHELGHVLGHGDLDDILSEDVTNGWLPAGVRRL